MTRKKVLIVMGSDSDLPVMQDTAGVLDKFGVEYDMHIASAHRTPDKVAEMASAARGGGFGVIISGAGMAAHLGGVIASHTILPVIGVPLHSGTLGGLDAMLATVQMPRGVPVATVGIGKAGAYNAGLLAVAILAQGNEDLTAALENFRAELAKGVEEKDAALQRKK